MFRRLIFFIPLFIFLVPLAAANPVQRSILAVQPFWRISFTDSIHVLLLANMTTLSAKGLPSFSIIIDSDYGPPNPANITVNHETYPIWHTDQCCYEKLYFLNNLRTTGFMIFDLSMTLSGNHTLNAWGGYE